MTGRFTPPPKLLAGAFLFMAALSASAETYSCNSPVDVLTSQYGPERTSVNTQETCLLPSNAPNMALQIELPLPIDAASCLSSPSKSACCTSSAYSNPSYTQPLYVGGVSGVTNASGSVNLVIVTTLTGQVFAYDSAFSQTTYACNSGTPVGKYYWATNFITNGDCGSGAEAIQNPATALPFAGVLSTPAIDKPNGLIYVVSGCQTDASPPAQRWYLHIISLTTGDDASGSPIDIAAGESGNGVFVPSVGGAAGAVTTCGSGQNVSCLPLKVKYQVQRAALTLAKLTATTDSTQELYVAFAVNNSSENEWNDPSGGDTNAYHGWLIGFPIGSNGLPAQSYPNFAFATTANFGGLNDSTCTDVIPSGPYAGKGQTDGQNYDNCGLGGGIWMSGRAPAVYTDSSTIGSSSAPATAVSKTVAATQATAAR